MPKNTTQGKFRLVFLIERIQAAKFNYYENPRNHKHYEAGYSQRDTPINIIYDAK